MRAREEVRFYFFTDGATTTAEDKERKRERFMQKSEECWKISHIFREISLVY